MKMNNETQTSPSSNSVDMTEGNIPDALFFVGAGGIGMTNLERYYLSKGSAVGG